MNEVRLSQHAILSTSNNNEVDFESQIYLSHILGADPPTVARLSGRAEGEDSRVRWEARLEVSVGCVYPEYHQCARLDGRRFSLSSQQ